MTFWKNLALGAALLLARPVAAQKTPAAPAPAAAATPTLAQTLRASRWQKRILLVGAPATTTPELAQQKQLLGPAGAELKKRDFLVLQLIYSQLAPADRQYWTQELKLPLSGFAVALIGKDGGVKLNQLQPVAPAELFGVVDKMPMRRQEAKGARK